MKTLLCCIARKENRYLREYVEYYKELGFTHICLYDNNYEGEEHIEDVIGDYVDDGFVEIIDYRDKGREMLLPCLQIDAYEECYRKYGKEYDWVAFFDCDEFLAFADGGPKNIEEALSWTGYDGYDAVCVNWMLFTDGGMLSDDGKPVLQRFVEPMLPYDKKRLGSNICNNDLLKVIVRGGLDEFKLSTVHFTRIPNNVCNNVGEKITWVSGSWPVNFERMYLKHFRCKTVDEFMLKIERGYPDTKITSVDRRRMLLSMFFQDNEPTAEKLTYIKEKYDIDLFGFYNTCGIVL